MASPVLRIQFFILCVNLRKDVILMLTATINLESRTLIPRVKYYRRKSLITDLISNRTIARRGYPKMGYAACFAGPIFNTLLGLGLTYGIEAASTSDLKAKIRLSNMAPGCLTFLFCSLLTTIIYMNITASIARRSYGYLLYSLYLVFILIQFLSEFHVIHPLGTDHRADEPDGR